MFRIDFGSCMLENIEELLLSVFFYVWARAYVRSLDSCVWWLLITSTAWPALASKGPSLVWTVCRAFSWVLTCWGGSTLLRPSTTSIWCRITCFSHRGLWKSVSVWLGLSFFTCWGPTSLPMVGKWCLWGGWPSFRTLERHRGPTRGKHVLPIFTPPLTLSAGALYGSL